MAPRTGTGKSGKDRSAPPPGGAADLELTDDQRYALTEQHRKSYERLLAVKKDADAKFKNHCKIIKAELGKDGLEDIKGLIEASSPDGEARIKEDVERQMRLLRWLGVASGTQADMFSEPDRTPITERAFADGKRAGLAGDTHKNPHHVATEAHRFWNDGYAEGQTTLTKGFKSMDPPQGSKPRNDGGLAEMNRETEEAIKNNDIASLGKKPASYEVN